MLETATAKFEFNYFKYEGEGRFLATTLKFQKKKAI